MENQLPRLTVKEISNETLKFFNLEKGLLFTFISLLKKPYETVQAYLNLDRRKYSNPLQYILVGTAFYILLLKVHPSFKTFISYTQKMNAKNYGVIEKQFNISIMESFNKAQDIYLSYQNLFYLIIIPAIGLLTYLLFKNKYNYAENLAINAFVFGTITWLSIILTLITIFLNIPIIYFTSLTIIGLFLMTYMYKSIYKISWLLGLGTMILVYFINSIITMVIEFGLTVYFML